MSVKKETNCIYCGKPLKPGSLRYCDSKCQREYKREKHDKKCQACKRVFKGYYYDKFCPQCKKSANKVVYGEHTPKPRRKAPDKSFDDFIKAQKEAAEKGVHLSYGKWAAMQNK